MEKKKKEEMPAEAKLLLEMIQKAGEQGVTREEMRNTPLGDLFKNSRGSDWLEAHKKIECHARNLINTWFLYKERESAEELPECFKQTHSTSNEQ